MQASCLSVSIQVTLPIFPAAEVSQEVGTDQEGTGYGNTHNTSFHPSVLDIEYPPPPTWLPNIPYLTLIEPSWFSSLWTWFIIVRYISAFVLNQYSTVVCTSSVQYFISGKIRSSCFIGSQSYHPTDQWPLPFYFLISPVSLCQHREHWEGRGGGDTSPLYKYLHSLLTCLSLEQRIQSIPLLLLLFLTS